MINKFFKILVSNGIYPQTPKTEIKKIKTLNYCCLILFVNIIFFSIIDFISFTISVDVYISYSFQLIILALVFYFHKKERYVISRISFLIISFFVLIYNANVVYQGFYGEYMYIFLPLISLFFFENKKIHFIILVISLLLFYVPNFFLNIYPEPYFGYLNVLFLFLGSFLVVYYFKLQNTKNENALERSYISLEKQKEGELAGLQLKVLKAQMNPHFMFNALNSIQNLILKGDKIEAYNYLTKFSSLIRENLNMSEKSFVSFDQELSLLKKYLSLEKLRFQENFSYNIKGINTIEDIKIPSMIIQPFLENAIKHGLMHKTRGNKELTIEFHQNKVLKCVITDNGIGLEKSKEINKKNNSEASFSTGAIKKRLKLLKDFYQLDLGIFYEDIKDGTKVIIKIPYSY